MEMSDHKQRVNEKQKLSSMYKYGGPQKKKVIYPDWPWGSPILLYNGHRVSFLGIKWPGHGVAHPPLSIKGKAVPLQAWSGPEGPRKLRFPDFMTTAQDGGKIISLMHRPPLPPGNNLVLISVRNWVNPRAIVQPAGLCR
jgi:hypothetical protein